MQGFTVSLSDARAKTYAEMPGKPQSPEGLGASYTLSLDRAIELALRNNKPIQVQQQEIAVARANITAAESKFLPYANVGYSFSWTDSVYTTNELPDRRKDTRIFTGYKSDNELNFTGGQMVYDGGASIASLKQARLQLKIQQQTLRSKILQVEYNVRQQYYALLYAYEAFRIAKDLVDQAEAHYENTRTMFEQGTASKFEVLQSKVQVSLAIPQLVDAERSIELAAASLKTLIYATMTDELKAAGTLEYAPIELREQAFLSEAYANNPLVKLNILGVDLKKWAIEQAKSGWYPNISATTKYSNVSDQLADIMDSQHNNFSVGLTANFSIFDGLATKAKVDAAKAQYLQSVYNYENITEQVAFDVRQACLNMKESSAIIAAQKDNLEEAKEALRISYIRFDNGVGINLDVIDSQTTLAQVRNNLALGMYNYLVACASLDEVMGREYFETHKNPEVVNADDKKE
jgi:outer membrane protein TolC